MKNNSFRYTFYFGLSIILVLCGVIALISINVYSTFQDKSHRKKQDTVSIEVPIVPEKQIVHDTVIVEKIVVKSIDTSIPKKEKNTPVVKDTTTTD